MSKGKIITVIGVLFAIYVAAAPYITVHQMKSAAENYDGEALSEHIEFPSVRQSIKDQMNAMIMKEMAKDEMKDNQFAALGVTFAGVMVDKMVDAYVTPTGITQLMAGEKPKPTEGGESGDRSGRKPLSDASMSYESLEKFVVKVKGGTGEEGTFVLRRRGIGWKLTEIIIPLDSTSTQCTKDTDCKGERICERGACTAPPGMDSTRPPIAVTPRSDPLASPPQIQQKPQPPLILDLSKYVGRHAGEVFEHPAVSVKFRSLLGNEYDHFLANLGVALRLELKGNFYMGSGSEAPTQRGIEESAFAINKETGEAFACILSGEKIKCYDVPSQYNLPAPLHDWYKESESSLKRGKLLASMYEIMKTKGLTDKDLASCGFDVDNENVRVTTELLDEVILCLRRKKAH